jgi:hypothetical protein
MSKFKQFWRNLFDVLDDILAYILTIIGIMVANYIPLLKTTGTIQVEADWWRIAISAIVALMIVGKQEKLDADEAGSTTKSREGRKNRFTIRMFNALSQGIAWQTMIDMASK